MGARTFYVYILASKIGGALYIGVTNDLVRRVAQHKAKLAEGFTKKYGVDRLVYFECFEDVEQAIHREKRLKKWPRAWKIKLIEDNNPNWSDLIRDLRERDEKAVPRRSLEYWVARSSRAMTGFQIL
jgi:putative endonuclease